MGTTTDPRGGRRASKRGLVSFVSFLLLFAFALGQSSSLMALAEGADADPVATEDAASEDASGDATLPVAEAPAAEAPAEDPQAEDPQPATESTERTEGSADADVVVAADTPGPPSGDGVQPTVVLSNPKCSDVLPGEFLFFHKTGVPQDDTINLSFDGGTGTLVIDVHSDSTFDFTFTGDFVAIGVIVKGGPNANFYDYSPDGDDADTALHAPVNPQNDKFYGLSHIEFCIGVPVLEPAIDIEKVCPASAEAGADITYEITIENVGEDDLENIEVWDTVDGNAPVDLSDLFPDSLAAGAASVTVQWVYEADGSEPDPLPNEVTVTADGVTSEESVDDTDGCETDIVNPQPDIDVEKSCTALAHVGDTVTYTITVTNVGDEDLDDVTVMDTVLGDLSASFADSLAVGASESHQFDYVVLESDPDPLPNEVTATGTGTQSEVSVDDTALCETDVIHPGIDIVKTVSEEIAAIGDTVTYTYVVTNTGDTTLYDISVDDNILGHIGDIAILEPGDSETLTKDFVVGDEAVTNVGTAEGEDILGRSVSADDDALVTPIAGENPPEENPPTPFTGSDAGRLGIFSMVLFGIGVTVVAATRRRRPEREAA